TRAAPNGQRATSGRTAERKANGLDARRAARLAHTAHRYTRVRGRDRSRARGDERAIAKFAAEGLLQSGTRLNASEKRAQDTLLAFAARVISEVLDALKEIYGTVPAPALGWIREMLVGRFEGYAKARGAALAEQRTRMHVPTSGVQEQLDAAAFRAKRDLEIALQPIELRARLGAIAKGDLPSAAHGSRDIDAFISHASEDKAALARPLADELKARGYSVWLAEYELRVGDSVYGSIDDGLRRARFGVVILSRNFFAKNWPRRELSALAALGDA